MDTEKQFKTEIDTEKQFKADFTTDIDSPPPYSSTNGSQTLDVNYRNFPYIIITDSAGQELLISQVGSSSTRLEFLDRNKQIIGSSKSSCMTAKINIEMSTASGLNHAFEIHNSAGILGGSPTYKSPAFQGHEMAWKNKAMSRKIIYELIDGHGTSYAKFRSDPETKIGKLEISELVGEDRFNEVVVTLLTLLYRKLRNIEISTLVAIAS